MPFGFFVEINPTDPGFGNRPGGGDAPDNSLPPGAPGHPSTGPVHPPRPWPPLPPPVGTWPPRVFPPNPVDPDWGIDAGIAPGQPIYLPPDRVDNGLPPVASTKPPQNPPPGTIWPPIDGAPDGKFILLAGIPGIGWRYVVVDSSLVAGMPLPGGPPPVVDNTLPETAEPKPVPPAVITS